VDPRGFHTITLGCKLNQFDTAGLAGELVRRGFRERHEPADASVVILNTCTVTGKADADARRLIRRVKRESPHCRLLVTGCYAELDREAIRRMDGVDHCFGNREKAGLPAILDALGIGSEVPSLGDRGCDATPELPQALHFGDRSRAFLKVQEGCRLACSYCIIPRVRGASRSIPPERVLEAADGLYAAGYREIVLTGVNVGDYGRDLDGGPDLAGLLRRMVERCGANRIRLNSLEPLTVTDEIIDLLASGTGLAPHLQVPLQSGAAAVLQRMRRNYRPEAYLALLERLRVAVPQIGLGADVIVGFPGETDTLFRQSHDFIAASPLNYLHVFSWSPRPGTPAAEMPGRVDRRIVAERSSILRALAEEMGYAFRGRFVGRRLDAIALAPRATDGKMRALTGNFIEVALPAGSARPGERIDVRLESVARRETLAHVERDSRREQPVRGRATA
jgi:threonylcarbamoyladenosine tRNA methylthiotransferase MtaB